MKNLLVALDLNHNDVQLLGYARQLGHVFDAKIWILHIAAPDPDFVGFELGPQYIRDTRAEQLRDEHKKLQQLADQLRTENLEAEALLVQGPTVEMIEKEVEKLKIDLLIMGSHPHGFLYETFVGHTSIKMFKTLSVPIMIIPIANDE